LGGAKIFEKTALGQGLCALGLVAGLFAHTEDEKFQVATGDYNLALDAKITGTKRTCSLP